MSALPAIQSVAARLGRDTSCELLRSRLLASAPQGVSEDSQFRPITTCLIERSPWLLLISRRPSSMNTSSLSHWLRQWLNCFFLKPCFLHDWRRLTRWLGNRQSWLPACDATQRLPRTCPNPPLYGVFNWDCPILTTRACAEAI